MQTAHSYSSVAFDLPVKKNGYAWWYIDFVSEDRQIAMTVIAFVGSVFSPYYASARKKGLADPHRFCSINAVLYKRFGKRWAMTERSDNALRRGADFLEIGPSGLHWENGNLVITLNEKTFPIPGKVCGTIRLTPSALNQTRFELDDAGEHFWQPIAPICHAEITLTAPALSLKGEAYIDHNSGFTPLETSFHSWDWSRGTLSGQRSVLLYNRRLRNGQNRSLGVVFDRHGEPSDFTAPTNYALPAAPVWRVNRQTQSEKADPEVVRTLEDTPFYVRSLIRSQLLGEDVLAVHESLDMNRFTLPIVQLMLPFRMPRNRFYRMRKG